MLQWLLDHNTINHVNKNTGLLGDRHVSSWCFESFESEPDVQFSTAV